MAPLAALAKASAMHVVAQMTGIARRGHGDILTHRFAVAGFASKALVAVFEDKVRLLVVVEPPERPAVRVMAVAAFRSELALVPVGLLVTADAVERCPLVGGGKVALLALDDSVQTDEWEARQIVIEKYLIRPPADIVAALALGAQPILVNVVSLMTGLAGRTQFLLVHGTLVAGFTGEVCVSIA